MVLVIWTGRTLTLSGRRCRIDRRQPSRSRYDMTVACVGRRGCSRCRYILYPPFWLMGFALESLRVALNERASPLNFSLISFRHLPPITQPPPSAPRHCRAPYYELYHRTCDNDLCEENPLSKAAHKLFGAHSFIAQFRFV